MDQVFLRKLKAINKEPIRYLAPFIFTAVLGVSAALAVLAVSAVPTDAGMATGDRWRSGGVPCYVDDHESAA